MATFLLLDDDDAELIAELLEDHQHVDRRARSAHQRLSDRLYAHAEAVSPEWLTELIRHEARSTEGRSGAVLDALQQAQDAILEELRGAGLDAERFALTTAEAERARFGVAS